MVLIAAGIAAVSLPPETSNGAGPSSPSPEQLEAIEAKERALAAQGVVRQRPDPSAPVISGPQPSYTWQQTVHVSHDELIQRIDEATRQSAGRWEVIARTHGASVANEARRRFLEQQEQLKLGIPPEGKTLTVEMAHVGEHSIEFSDTSYKTDGSSSDPVSAVFYGVGSEWDVDFDLRYWTSQSWESSDGGICGDPSQSVWLNEVDHGGVNSWYYQDNGWQRVQDQCAFGDRAHMRFWAARTYDAYHGYGSWSVATPHWETIPWYKCIGPSWNQTCWWDYSGHHVYSWEEGRAMVERSFRTGNSLSGTPLWFVGAIYRQTVANAGQYKGLPWDGQAVFVRLDY